MRGVNNLSNSQRNGCGLCQDIEAASPGGLRSAVSARSPSEQYRTNRGWTGLRRSCPAPIFRSFRNDSSATLFQISRTVLHCLLRINRFPVSPVLGLVFESLVPHFQVICFSFRNCSSIFLTYILSSSSSQRPNFVA